MKKSNDLEKEIIIKGSLNYPEKTHISEFGKIPNSKLANILDTLMHSDPKIISEIKGFHGHGEIIDFMIERNVTDFIRSEEGNIYYKKINEFIRSEFKQKCNSIFGAFESRILEFRKYQKKINVWLIFAMITFAISSFLVMLFLDVDVLSNIIDTRSLGGFLIALSIGLIPFIIVNVFFMNPNIKKRDKIKLKQKEKIIYTLIKISNLIESYVSDHNNNHFKQAKEELVIFFNTVLPNKPKSRGYTFDNEIVEFYSSLGILLEKYLKVKLDFERDDTKLLSLCYQLRKIALMINEEKLPQATKYIEKDFGLKRNKDAEIALKVKKMFHDKQIGRWVLSSILFGIIAYLIILGVLFILSISGFYSDEIKVGIEGIIMIAFAILSAILIIPKIKSNIIDKTLDYLLKEG